MTTKLKFLDIAADALRRGLSPVPLLPKSKQTVEKGWQTKFYSTLEDLPTFPEDSGCGSLCSSDGNWIFDVDCPDWFTSEFPQNLLPCLDTFTVKTGGGGYQYHFRQDDYSREHLHNKSLKNPDPIKFKKATGAECTSVFDVLFDKHQGLLPGSIHPGTGMPYMVHRDQDVVAAPRQLVDWLVKVLTKKLREKKVEASPFVMRQGWKPEAEFDKVGFKVDRNERNGEIYFDYHQYRDCLVRFPDSHVRPGESRDPRQCAFVLNPDNGHFYHQCFSSGCEPGFSSTKKALKEIGIDYKKVFACDGQKNVVALNFQDDVLKEHLRYLWPGYLPNNKLVHFAGNSAEGKSPVAHDLLARVSAGLAWPDGTPNTLGPLPVLILSGGEDSFSDTVAPRLEFSGGNLKNIHFDHLTVTKGMDEFDMQLALDDDIELCDELIQLVKPALVVFDPITNYLGKLKMNDDKEVRRALMPLRNLAEDHQCCIITIGHLNRRDKGTSPKQRVMGAAAFHSVARFMYMFGPDDEGESKYCRIMAQDRGCGSPTLRYETVSIPKEWDGETSNVVLVKWNGISEATSEDAADPATGKEKSRDTAAAKAAREFLGSGCKKKLEILEHLSNAGFEVAEDKLNFSRVMKLAKAKYDKKFWGLATLEEQTSFN